MPEPRSVSRTASTRARTSAALRERWERYAQADAEYYIWTDVATLHDFAASGERDAEHLLKLASSHLGRRGQAVDIGCGVGRIALPMARRFERVLGVDIAPTMLRKLEANARAAGLRNVVGILADEPWDAEGPVDFAYSHMVLQHIEDWGVISGYFERLARCLAPDGCIYAHFDTRPPNLLYRVKNTLPDPVLPRYLRRGVRRIRRTRDQVLEMTARFGLRPVLERGMGTDQGIFIFRHA